MTADERFLFSLFSGDLSSSSSSRLVAEAKTTAHIIYSADDAPCNGKFWLSGKAFACESSVPGSILGGAEDFFH